MFGKIAPQEDPLAPNTQDKITSGVNFLTIIVWIIIFIMAGRDKKKDK